MKMIPLVPLSKRFLALSALFFYLAAPTASWACSSVVVGKDASATGNVLLSRTEDVRPGIAARFVVYPRGYYKKGVPVKMDRNGFAFTFSHDSYKFTGTPMTTYSSVMMAKGSDETVTPNTNEDGVNEHGLAVSATNTTAFAQEIGGEGGLDPMPDSNAWREESIVSVLLGECKTVGEALDLIGRIVQTNGIEACIFTVADKKEAWIVESISGHRWIASRVPDDGFVIVANDLVANRVDLDDPENFRGSADYRSFIEEKAPQLARYNGDGSLNIARTYGGDINNRFNSYRRWRGYNLFAPSRGITPLTTRDQTYPFSVRPDAGMKISPTDIMNVQRDRFRDTPVNPPQDLTVSRQIFTAEGRETEEVTDERPRPFGYYTQIETHVYEMVKGFPPDIGARFWIAMSQAEFSVNLPFYGNITDTHPFYRKDIYSEEANVYQNDSAYWLFAHTNYLARGNRAKYGLPIQAYWRAYELKLYEDQKGIEKELLRLYSEKSPEAAAKFITAYTMDVADKAFAKAEKLHDALVKHIETRSGDLFVISDDPLAPPEKIAAKAMTEEEKIVAEKLLGPGFNALDPKTANANVAVSSIPVAKAPKTENYDFITPSTTVDVTVQESNGALKVVYNADLSSADLKALTANSKTQGAAALDNARENLSIIWAPTPEAAPKTLIGPGPDALVSFSKATDSGFLTLYPTSDDGANITLNYFLVDGEGTGRIAENLLFVKDGKTDGKLSGSIWLAVAGSARRSLGNGHSPQ